VNRDEQNETDEIKLTNALFKRRRIHQAAIGPQGV